MSEPSTTAESPAPPSGFKKIAFLSLCVLLIASIGVRAYFVTSSPTSPEVAESSGPTAEGQLLAPNSLVPGDQDHLPGPGEEGEPGTMTTGTEPEPTQLEQVLPYLTEGSFFALIGFALGYASRKVVKVGLILLALIFVGLQGLSYLEVIHIDWNRAIEVLNNLILNLHENETVTEVLKDRVPTVGGLGAGYLLGFRRG